MVAATQTNGHQAPQKKSADVQNRHPVSQAEALLTGVAEAARQLLAIADFDSAVNGAMEAIARAANIDRIFILKHHSEKAIAPSFATCPYEWTAAGIPLSQEVPNRFPMVYSEIEGFSEWVNELKAGQCVQKLKGEMSAAGQAIQEVDRTLSVLTVPIFIEGKYWGNFGFDDCTQERVWSEAETAVLETAAATFAAALQRPESIAMLQSRDELLDSVNAAAHYLVANENLAEAIPEALRILGERARQDRVYVLENVYPQQPNEVFWNIPYEWTTSTVPLWSEDAERDLPVAMASFPTKIVSPLWDRQTIQFSAHELHGVARSINEKAQAVSTVAVPIAVLGKWWGVLGFDDCTAERVWNEAEIAVLETAAACIGSAIQRDQIRQAHEAAERTAIIERERAARTDELEAANKVLLVRDKWLQTTAAAANQLLSATDVPASVNAALATIGENLACDRLSVMHYLPDLDNPPMGAMKMLYEWDAEGIRPQIEDLELNTVSSDGFGDWFERIAQGECVGSRVSRLPEPARSEMASLNVLSTYAVPIFINEKLWGIVGIDYCREERQLGEAELAVFKTAATCVGSAIHQAQVRRDETARAQTKLLGSVAKAANLLLRTADYERVLPEVTRLLGEAVGSDRCSVTQDVPCALSDSGLGLKLLHEWCADGIAPLSNSACSFLKGGLIPLDGSFFTFHQTLLRGEAVNFMVSDAAPPESIFLEAQGNTSMLIVPIMVEGKCWGEIGFDNCGEPRLYDEAEIAILQIAAESIASAIARQAKEASVHEAEERYRNLIELSTEGIYRLELDEPIPRDLPVPEQVKLFYERFYGAEANDAFATMYGYQSAEEMMGWRLTDIHVEASAQNIEFMNALASSPDLRISNSESEELDVAGNVHYFLNNVIGIIEDNKLVRAWGTQTDITELRLAQKAREEAEKAVLEEREKAAYDRATELSKTNEAIAQTLTTLTSTPELDDFLGQLLAKLSEPIAACKAHLFLYDERTHTLRQHMTVQDGQTYKGAAPSDPEMLRHPVPADLSGAWQAITSSEKPFTMDERNSSNEKLFWTETVPWHREQGHLSATCACMKVGDTPIGFIGFAFRHLPLLTDEQLEFVQALANQATLAIQLTRLAEEAKQTAVLQAQEKAASERAAKLAKTNEALSKTLTVLTTESELDSFLSKILLQINEKIGVNDSHLFLYSETTHTLRQRIAVQGNQVFISNAPNDPDIFKHPIPADITQAWQILVNSSKPFTLDDNNPEAAEFLWPGTAEWHSSRGHQAATCVCMRVGNKPIGFIGFAFCGQTILTDEQLEFIQALTNQATLSIHLTYLAEQSQSAALSIALTEERNRLAREIHDTLAQAFTGVSLQLEAAKDCFTDSLDDALHHIEQAGSLARRGLSEARRSVRALRAQALTTDTLPNALRTALTEMTQASPTTACVRVVGRPYVLPEDIQTNLLRIGQEATTNALRHAKSDRLDLTLTYAPEQIRMTITDNGIGCDISLDEVEGFGLLGMRERVLRFDGTFSFVSTPGEGTVIAISIPNERCAPLFQKKPQ